MFPNVGRPSVVSQFYESQVYDEYTIRGNAAVLKCNIPSFVSDHVEIIEWVDSNGEHYTKDENNSGKYQHRIMFISVASADVLQFLYQIPFQKADLKFSQTLLNMNKMFCATQRRKIIILWAN